MMSISPPTYEPAGCPLRLLATTVVVFGNKLSNVGPTGVNEVPPPVFQRRFPVKSKDESPPPPVT